MFKVAMEWRGIKLGACNISTDDLAERMNDGSGVTYTILAYWPAGLV